MIDTIFFLSVKGKFWSPYHHTPLLENIRLTNILFFNHHWNHAIIPNNLVLLLCNWHNRFLYKLFLNLSSLIPNKLFLKTIFPNVKSLTWVATGAGWVAGGQHICKALAFYYICYYSCIPPSLYLSDVFLTSKLVAYWNIDKVGLG